MFPRSWAIGHPLVPLLSSSCEQISYIDILATPAPGSCAKTAYLIELKYLSPKAATDEAKEEALTRAKAQIERYEQSDLIKPLSPLKRIVALFVGLQLAKLEID